MDQREKLLAEYVGLESRGENVAWDVARWLAANVPLTKSGPSSGGQPLELTTAELADEGYRTKDTLNKMRQVALAFGGPVGVIERRGREVVISVDAHLNALRAAGGDVDAARAALLKGGKVRDHRQSKAGYDLIAAKNVLKNPEMAAELFEDEEVRDTAYEEVHRAIGRKEGISDEQHAKNEKSRKKTKKTTDEAMAALGLSEFWLDAQQVSKYLDRMIANYQVAQDQHIEDGRFGATNEKIRGSLDKITTKVAKLSAIVSDMERV